MTREEAIKIIESNCSSGSKLREACAMFIPELAESEDERIMKAIEGAIRIYGKTQGEWIGGYDMDTLVVHLRKAFGALEKQKEHQLARWSEEDKQILNAAIDMVEKGNVFFTFENTKYKVSDWLKLLPERFNLLPKAEWSEEDKENWQIIISHLDAYQPDRTKPNPLYKQIEWLKSLRPQPHWRPSDEQIKAMEEVRTIFHHHHLWDEINPILYDYEELMRDLYKLM